MLLSTQFKKASKERDQRKIFMCVTGPMEIDRTCMFSQSSSVNDMMRTNTYAYCDSCRIWVWFVT